MLYFVLPSTGTNTEAVLDANTPHFHDKGNPPSSFTIEKYKNEKVKLPFDDTEDFKEQSKGFIAKPDYLKIYADNGEGENKSVAWDMERYQFLLAGKDFASIHPSLQRQAILNMNYGLYEVIPRIYQIRGYDLANITFIQGDTGWIVFDTLTSKETAKAALDFINQQLGERPVVAVVYSHTHGDHFGGVRGVVDEADVISGKVKVIAPEHFVEHAVSENVAAGNAMIRRMFMQYGVALPVSPYGHVDQAIGKNVSVGNLGLIAPNVTISQPIETLTIDGIEMVFQNTPGTEAPAEMNTWFPQFKAFWAAENITGTIHNIYTLRGAKVRDTLAWSKYINKALHLFGTKADVMFASHNWPRWGNERIQTVMRGQRDMYAHMNNQVLHLANQGVTINEIHNEYEMPKSLQQEWYARSYHGSIQHNSRAVINRYLGYWDGNPATLVPLSPKDSAPLYVEMMGGAQPIINKAQALYDQGDYLLAVEILNKLNYAEPDNQAAKDLLADNYEQLGYQYESPSLRNSFLAGALELRDGFAAKTKLTASGPDVKKAISTELLLDYLAILIDGRKAAGIDLTVNLITPDNSEKHLIEISNETLTHVEGFTSNDSDLTLTVNRTDIELLLTGQVKLPELIQTGKMQFEGDLKVMQTIQSLVVPFTPDFEIIPGTIPSVNSEQK
ncbi:MAG: MBL fold metallo-hydrolase [Gammaproteobacteria bacterium]|nr:MBL fold metallo-hydrolase [Gammaproteobacteria bacterium]